jgi:hypothetical protein
MFLGGFMGTSAFGVKLAHDSRCGLCLAVPGGVASITVTEGFRMLLRLHRIINELSRTWLAVATALLLSAFAPVATAETLMMPDRDMRMGTPEVVWGITTLPNGSTFTIDFGDGTSTASAAVTDRSYIAINHTYNASGVFTAKLTVVSGGTTETATVQLQVFNPATLSAFDLRNLDVNRAIQDGLRWLWTQQSNRTTFNTTNETGWTHSAYTALVVQAFQNHGYRLTPNANGSPNADPTGIYPKYIVRRALNFVFNRLTVLTIGVTPAGNDPCVNVPAPVCTAFASNNTGDVGYENPIAIAAVSGSLTPNRVADETTNAGVAGKTFAEILQRMVNAQAWGQSDGSGAGEGGWRYGFNDGSSDGSTAGWNILGFLDAQGAGATVPPWVKTEYAKALANGLNDTGSYDYIADNSRLAENNPNIAKTGVGIQGMFWTGRPASDTDAQHAATYISDRWNTTTANAMGQVFNCSNGTFNKGCSYAMFNVFKGLRFYGIQTLPGVSRPAGPGPIVANDWYADYVDYLLANQTNPTSTSGGSWGTLGWSCCDTNTFGSSSLALLILAPVTLVPPDPTKFASVGLLQGNPLSTNPATNIVGTQHTVTAQTLAADNSPIPGTTVNFSVLTGPNAGANGSGITGTDGRVTFTYTDTGGLGDDTIRASVGSGGSTLFSNTLVKHWVPASIKCDADGDGKVTLADLRIIAAANGQVATGPSDPRDGNGDGVINVADARFCQLRLTPAAPQ